MNTKIKFLLHLSRREIDHFFCTCKPFFVWIGLAFSTFIFVLMCFFSVILFPLYIHSFLLCLLQYVILTLLVKQPCCNTISTQNFIFDKAMLCDKSTNVNDGFLGVSSSASLQFFLCSFLSSFVPIPSSHCTVITARGQ